MTGHLGGFTLMPMKPGTCKMCGVDHDPDMAHNQQSMAYQYRFYRDHGRWPTWADAIAHCQPKMKAYWRESIESRGLWTEPEAGVEPIAEIYERA